MPLYRFAGLTVEMNPVFPTLQSRCAPYLLPESGGVSPKADISVQLPAPPAQSELPLDDPDADGAEYLFAGGIFYRKLLRFSGMMLHASAVGYGGRAYLFSAPSGTGKSTHTAGWREALGKGCVILNDDKPALRLLAGEVFACGTPFSGSSPLNADLMLPVGGICLLSRGTNDARGLVPENKIERITPEQALPGLYRETVRVLSRRDGERMLDLLWEIASRVPLWRLQCGMGREAVRCSFEAMTGERLPGVFRQA